VDAPQPTALPTETAARQPTPGDGRDIAIEEWFLRRGMPTVTRESSGLARLLVRAAPALLAVAGVFLTTMVVTLLLREIEPDTHAAFDDPATVLPRWYLIALVTGIVLALGAGIVANRLVRHRPPGDPAARIFSIAAPLALVALPIADGALGASDTPWADLVANAISILLTLLVIRSGLAAIVVWSLRQALSQGSALASLAARALPMIVLVTLFAFLSEGLWRVSGALSRNELWLVVAILLGIAAVFVWTVIQGEVRQLTQSPRCPAAEIAAHGFPVVETDSAATARPAPLTKREMANALVVLFIALAIQVGSLVLLVFVFFCVFGSITVPPSVVEVWTGHLPTTGRLLGMRLPVQHELIQASLILAAFSAVSFAASSVSDPMYRQSFFEPILRDMRVTIAARSLYRASGPDIAIGPEVDPREPVPASGGPIGQS
jgi:hypothetical protein